MLLCSVNFCIKLAYLHPAMLLTRKFSSIKDFVHLICKADVRLNRLIQCYGDDEVMSLDDLLIVVAQANTRQAKESLIAWMFRPDVNCLIALFSVWVCVAIQLDFIHTFLGEKQTALRALNLLT